MKIIPRAVIFGNPEKAMAQLSPDGSYISYIAPHKGVLNIFVAPVAKPEEAKPITFDTKRGIRMHLWLYNGHRICYLQDSDGDENMQLHVVDLINGKDSTLTPAGSKA